MKPKMIACPWSIFSSNHDHRCRLCRGRGVVGYANAKRAIDRLFNRVEKRMLKAGA